MRITNSMMTNNILLSMNKNKEMLSVYEQQIATGKKIQKPSDDPIIAVRALKFRTNVREIDQYKTNAEDANSWMTVTEQAVSTSTDILKRIRDLCVQASSDTATTSNRKSIVSELKQLKSQLVNEGNVSYAGRYVFSGYKTDKPLVFLEPSTDQYEITEHFTPENVEKTQRAFNDQISDVYRIRLGYKEVIEATPPGTIEAPAGNPLTINVLNSSDAGAYEPVAGEVSFLKDTGELIFNETDVPNLEANFDFIYDKAGFNREELVPDHYYDCTNKTAVPIETYTRSQDRIQYQISFNQEITVNTMGHDMIEVDAVRDIEELIDRTLEITEDGTFEEGLKEDLLGGLFSEAIGKLDVRIESLLDLRAEIGGKVNRVGLTINRLEEDSLNFTDLLSKNEDIDLAEVMVKLQSQEMVYQASLMSSSKIIQPTLLDFIR